MATNNAINNKGSLLNKNFFGLNLPWERTVGVIAGTIDQIRTFPFVLESRIVVSKLVINVSTLQASKNAVVGVYSSDGTTKLIDSGAISVATTGTKTATLGTAVTLDAGTYIFAWSCDGTTAQAGQFSVSSLTGIINAFVTRVGTAANAMSSLVLPSSLSTITPVSLDPVAVMFSTE